MRYPSRAPIIGTLAIGAVLFLHEPLRDSTLAFVRLPFTVVKTLARALLLFPRLPELARENARLHTALEQRQLELAQVQETLRHVQQSQALLEAPSIPQGSVAVVIGRSTIPTQQTVLLNRGERQGIGTDDVVVDSEGVVGRIIDLHPTTALVVLLTDPESRVAGLVERSREAGLLIGRSLGRCEFIYLDAHADIEEGDRIVTAGLGGPFPKGLLLGFVVQVKRNEELGTAWAMVEPAARLGRLEEVLCLPSRSLVHATDVPD